MRFAAALLVAAAVCAQERYDGSSVLEINTADSVSFDRANGFFEANTYDVWRSAPGEGRMHVRVPDDRKDEVTNLLKHLNASTSMYIHDVQKLIDEQFEAANLTAGEDPFFTQWRTFDQILAFTRQLADNHDNVQFVPSIGRTIQGRDIFALRIGGQQGGPEGRAIYFQGGLHCREWVGISTTLYLAWSLLTTTDPEVVAMLRQLEVVIVPVVNADGYVFTHTTNRLWRKNRRQNTGSTCIGVDLNRNWDDHWSGPGSSPNPCSDTYHGTAPFSEPETKAVELYLMNVIGQQKHLIGAIDFHSFGQLILRPYGWCLPRDGVPENNEELRALGARMQTAIRDTHGLTYRNEHAAQLYVASGGADDWFYSVATFRSAGYCIELRDTGRSGFVLPPAQIIPTGQEAFAAMKPFMRHMLDKPLP